MNLLYGQIVELVTEDGMRFRKNSGQRRHQESFSRTVRRTSNRRSSLGLRRYRDQ